jgi:hypothetical protein
VTEVVLTPIGFVRRGRLEPEDGGWDAEVAGDWGPLNP